MAALHSAWYRPGNLIHCGSGVKRCHVHVSVVSRSSRAVRLASGWNSQAPFRVSPISAVASAEQSVKEPQLPVTGHLIRKQVLVMFSASAVLGPMCDGCHSHFNVLHYNDPIHLYLPGGIYELETCWWVPLMFGLAGIILGLSVPMLDEAVQGASTSTTPPRTTTTTTATTTGMDNGANGGDMTYSSSPSASVAQSSWSPSQSMRSGDEMMARGYVPLFGNSVERLVKKRKLGLLPEPVGGYDPSWPFVLACISVFVAQYWLSGYLESEGMRDPQLSVLLASIAGAHWLVFDRSLQGLFMCCLTALAGPLLEATLILGPGLYHYSHPNVWDAIPAWIPWVYFCGGPAVGNLGRRVWGELRTGGHRSTLWGK